MFSMLLKREPPVEMNPKVLHFSHLLKFCILEVYITVVAAPFLCYLHGLGFGLPEPHKKYIHLFQTELLISHQFQRMNCQSGRMLKD